MKKSKIIFPALGVLILSSAAAVTGTVAWFTANLTAHIESSTISVVKSGSSLTAKAVAGYGTSTKDGLTVSHEQFIDGSVDMETGNVYKASYDKTGTTCEGFLPASEGVVAGQTKFSATNFTIELSMKMADEDKDTHYGVYVDPSQLVPALKTEGANDGQKALRVGFKTTTNWVIWAPYLGADHDKEALTYVNSESYVGSSHETASTASYAVGKRILSTATTETTYGTSSKLYLGDIVRTESANEWTNKIDVSVYTWFEGSVLKNISELGGEISLTLGFNALKK